MEVKALANSMLARTWKRSRLALERAKRGLTQAEVAAAVGIKRPHICEMELGRVPAYPAHRKKLAEFYGIPEERLFGDFDAVRYGMMSHGATRKAASRASLKQKKARPKR